MSISTFRPFESGYRPEKPEMHLQNSEKLMRRKNGEIARDLRFFVFNTRYLCWILIMWHNDHSYA